MFPTEREVVTVTAWIKSLRLSICFLAGLLAVAGFRIADIPISWLSVATIFFGACAAMLQNDWRDRFHDVHKGKILALRCPRPFLALLLAFWTVACGFGLASAIENSNIGIVLFFICLAAFVYSEVRLIPIAPIMLVALTTGSIVLLPIMAGADVSRVLPLFFSTVLIIFGREITKDLDDYRIDDGYKWTIPLAIGSKRAKVIAVTAIIAGLALAIKVSMAVLPAIVFAVIGMVLLVRGARPIATRVCLDVGVALVILIILFS